jgi:hypothetical protein
MNRFPFFNRRKSAAQTPPQRHIPRVPVNVTATNREPLVDGLAYEPCAETARHIRQHLPVAKPSLDLRAALAIGVIGQHGEFLAPGSGTPPPDLEALLDAYKTIEQFVFERVRIA